LSICCAVVKPGWPGSEKSTDNRFDTVEAPKIPAMKITSHPAITRRR
jgi:hypothetical protein